MGPALLVVALWRRSLRGSLAVGLVFGLAFFIPLLSWLVNVAWYAWAALAIIEALIFAVLAVGQRLLLRLRAWPLAVAGWWVAAEALRDRWPWGGFPWGRLAMSQASAPTARWVAVGGPPLLTFLIALAGASLAWLVARAAPRLRVRQRRPSPVAARRHGPAAAAAPLGRPCLRRGRRVAVGGAVLPVDQPGAGAPTATVAAVQGDVPHAGTLPSVLRATQVTANHAAATRRLAAEVKRGPRRRARRGDLAGELDRPRPVLLPGRLRRDRGRRRAINRPVLVGAVLDDPVRNAGQLWLPGRGPAADLCQAPARAVRRGHPVPRAARQFTSLPSLQPVNFTPGHRAVVFRVGKIRLGDVICYEVGFDSLVRSEVAAGANLLGVQTNDADFEIDGQTGETLQQLAMARIRAMEHDRSVRGRVHHRRQRDHRAGRLPDRPQRHLAAGDPGRASAAA